MLFLHEKRNYTISNELKNRKDEEPIICFTSFIVSKLNDYLI